MHQNYYRIVDYETGFTFNFAILFFDPISNPEAFIIFTGYFLLLDFNIQSAITCFVVMEHYALKT